MRAPPEVPRGKQEGGGTPLNKDQIRSTGDFLCRFRRVESTLRKVARVTVRILVARGSSSSPVTDAASTTANRTLPRRLPNAAYRPREYLTEVDVERLIEAAATEVAMVPGILDPHDAPPWPEGR
jgi:hypothetical protein